MAGYVFVAAHVLEAKMTKDISKSLWSFRAFSFCMHDYHCNAGVATDQGMCSPSVLKVKQWKYLNIHCITIASIFQEPPQTHAAYPGTAWLKMQTHPPSVRGTASRHASVTSHSVFAFYSLNLEFTASTTAFRSQRSTGCIPNSNLVCGLSVFQLPIIFLIVHLAFGTIPNPERSEKGWEALAHPRTCLLRHWWYRESYCTEMRPSCCCCLANRTFILYTDSLWNLQLSPWAGVSKLQLGK